jgi:signal transduction histidine kinase
MPELPPEAQEVPGAARATPARGLTGPVSPRPILPGFPEGLSRASDGPWIEIPGYRIVDELGRGGMGVVFKAVQVALDRLVAVKLVWTGVPVQLAWTEREGALSSAARFQREAQAAAQLHHPNIVPIYDMGAAGGYHYLSMQLMDGGSLKQRLPRLLGRPQDVVDLLAKVADAVQYAHERGLVHRDLKPSNILLDHRGQPQITDFGLAQRADDRDDLGYPGAIIGTPSYMPPEQASGHAGAVGPAADVYALGTILYEALTGQVPFRGANPMETLRQVLAVRPVPPRAFNGRVPAELERICLRCLEKEPQRRYDSAAALAADLRGFVVSPATVDRRPSLGTRLASRLRGWLGQMARREVATPAAPAEPAAQPAPATDGRSRTLPGTASRPLPILHAVLPRMEEGVIVVDEAGIIVLCNAAAERVFGPELTGLPMHEWLTRRACFLADGATPYAPRQVPLVRALRGQAAREPEMLVRVAEEAQGLWIDMSAWPLPLESQWPRGAVAVLHDVTEHKNLLDAEAFYHSLVDSLQVSVYRKDLEGRYTFVNRRFCLTLRKAADQVLGRTDFDLYPLDYARKYAHEERQVMEGRQILEELEEHISSACPPGCRCAEPEPAPGEQPADDKRYVKSLLAPVYGAEGQIIGSQGAFWSVTAQERARRQLTQEKAELQRANAELLRSNADLEQFAYVASHDLKEPLRMVRSFTQLLQRRYQDRLDATANEFIGYAVDGATRMHELIEDLLVYSRVSTQGKPLVDTDTEAAFAVAFANLQAAIEESGAEVLHDPLPRVRADETQLVQLFQNLIGNAIKFRSARPPVIRVRARRAGREWVFSVRDNGIGIDPGHQDRIFVIFQRLHTRAEYPGSGIGLAVCKRIVERHGGRIWVKPRFKGGSVFSFTIPVH